MPQTNRLALNLLGLSEIVITVSQPGVAPMADAADDTPLPERPVEIPAKPPKITACMKAVWLMIGRANGRLTQPKIARAMQDAGLHTYSDRWIADACQRLVEMGVIKRHPDGYEPVVDDGDEAAGG